METLNYVPPQTQFRNLSEPEIHFTPVKNSTVPRVWDRKPSTSYLTRSKPRKVWKRFRSSFNSMKAMQQMIAPEASGLKESEFDLEINTRRNTDYTRGVKRQCLVAKYSSDDENAKTNHVRGRSFLETKWESEVRKRRKLPAIRNDPDEHMTVDNMQVEEDEEMAEVGDLPGGTTSTSDSAVQDPEETGESPAGTPDPSDIGAAYPDALPGEPGRLPTKPRGVIVNIKSLDNIDQAYVHILTTNAADGAASENVLATVTDDQQLRSDVATVREGENQEPAMAVPVELTAEQESTLVRSALRSSLDGDDTELLNNFLSKAKAKREAKAAAAAQSAPAIARDPEENEEKEPQQQALVEIPTAERRVLEALDANSSPQKSPSKPENDEKTEGNDSASPGARRSTRVKSLQRAAAPGSLRTTLSLRRATGKEFIFLQRTEAQQLALETKRNTKQNKGDASLPKYTLQSLAKQIPDTSKALDDNIRRSNKPEKYVSWNEDRLVEFEGDESDDELAQATTTKTPEKRRAASSHNAHLRASLKIGGEKAAAAAAATTASPTAAPRGRRVRRLGPPKQLDSTLDAASSPLSPTTASPIAKRKKLTPKSQKSLSKIPTAHDAHERPSLLSGGRSVKTNLLKVNAGSTPMPRRVRRA
ncbi:hypothetical protein BDV12DRAFT_172037 [Aspergillus spectabilis]